MSGGLKKFSGGGVQYWVYRGFNPFYYEEGYLCPSPGVVCQPGRGGGGLDKTLDSPAHVIDTN